MTIDLNSMAFQQNPYDFYAKLRAEKPVMQVETANSTIGGGVLLTRYEDVLTALKDPRFSNEMRKIGKGNDGWLQLLLPNAFNALLNSMVMVDDPAHARLRNLVHKAFTPRMIQQMSRRIEAIADDLIDRMACRQVVKNQPVDLMADFALPLPLTVISEMMGVPISEREKFYQLIQDFLPTLSASSLWNTVKQVSATIGLQRFFRKLIAFHKQHPQDDLTSALIQAEEAGNYLSEDELTAMLFLLLFAGHETTVNLIGNGLLALLEYPDQLATLRANPDLLESAIEEMLRFTNPVQQIAPRYALEDIELSGQLISKGTNVMVGIASANRDESIFKEADQFEITRKPNPHVAFGFGIHYCLGAPLARLEADIAFRALLKRFSSIELAVPVSELQWRGAPALRGLKKLPLRVQVER